MMISNLSVEKGNILLSQPDILVRACKISCSSQYVAVGI